MRSTIYFSGTVHAPAHAPVPGIRNPEAPTPRVFERDDYVPHFDPEAGLIRDGDTVYLISLVEPHAYDGSMVAPIALTLRVYALGEESALAEASTTVHGPGPIAVGVPGLTPGEPYQFELSANYPDPPEDGSAPVDASEGD